MTNQTTRTRQLREDQTKAESRAWWLLRNRTLPGFKFRRQRPIGPFLVDFCCAELSLILELDGSVHSQPSVIKDDTSWDEFLAKEGYRVAHFSLKHEFSRNERSVSDDVGDSHLKLGRETGLELGEFFLGLRFGEPIVPP